MDKFKKILLVFVCSITIASCSHITPLTKASISDVQSNKKAVILYSSYLTSDGSRSVARLEFKNPISKAHASESAWNHFSGSFFGREYFLEVDVLDPGIYNLKKIYYLQESLFAYNSMSLTLPESDNFLPIVVKGGEVIYLGDIRLYHSGDRIKYNVVDEYKRILEDSKHVLGALHERLEKKLIYNH